MNFIAGFIFFVFFVCFLPPHAWSDDVDAAKTINDKLAHLKDYNLPDKCTQIQTGTRWHELPPRHTGNMDIDSYRIGIEVPIYANKCVPQLGKLAVKSLHFEKVTFDKAEVTKNALPEKVIGQSFISMNCTASKQGPSVEFSFTARHSTTITTSHGITNTLEATSKTTFKLSDSISSDLSLRDAYQVSNTTGHQTIDETSEGKTIKLPLVIDAMTNFVSEGWISESTDRLYWRATILVDGPVIENKDNVHAVSAVLSEADRTLILDGYIDNVHSTDVNNDYFGKPLTSKECDNRINNHLPLSYRLNYLIYPPNKN